MTHFEQDSTGISLESLQKLRNEREAQLSKLKSLKTHLSNLLAKKIRLELEIKQLKKTIQKRSQTIEKSKKDFSMKVSLENVLSVDSISPKGMALTEIEMLDLEISQELLNLQRIYNSSLKQSPAGIIAQLESYLIY